MQRSRIKHSSPETKHRYQLGLASQVREHLERVNERAYEGREPLHFRDSLVKGDPPLIAEVRN